MSNHKAQEYTACPNCGKKNKTADAYGTCYCDKKCCDEYDPRLAALNGLDGESFEDNVTEHAKLFLRWYDGAVEAGQLNKLNDEAKRRAKVCRAIIKLVA